MRVEKFNAKSNSKVSALIIQEFPMISFSSVKRLIKNKDIKINGKRISQDVICGLGDEIVFYVQDEKFQNLDIIFQDENIIVVNKPRKIEVVNQNGNSLESMIKKTLGIECYAVHRLDLNTTGLVVFAKNIIAKNELEKSFKLRTIEKYYYALVIGNVEKNNQDLIAYLKKDSKIGRVQISDFPQKGFEKIETKVNLVENYDNFALLNVELVTGKTHQIRAHLSHIGHPILGDEKYGNFAVNSEMNCKYQCLCSRKIVFHFENSSPLFYLDKKEIELGSEKIDFLKYNK